MIDVLYLTWNRREFTKFSLQMLVDNTDWSMVRQVVFHDDGSEGAQSIPNLISWAVKRIPAPCVVYLRPWANRFGSPPAVMNWYVENFGDSTYFAKVDSDIVVPPGWLGALHEVMTGSHPEPIELLGMEGGRMGPPGLNESFDGTYGFEPGSHIGGVGLMRTATFLRHPRLDETKGRFGFTEWQKEYRPVRGWIKPDLLVSELSRIPFEPWSAYAAKYVEQDWERGWPKYPAPGDYWWSWWPKK